MRTKVLLALLLGVCTLPALADGVFATGFQLAQLSPDEIAALRGHWDQASPEQREAMRRAFADRLREAGPEQQRRHRFSERWSGMTPEQREQLRERWMERGPAPGGYGMGFEQRMPGPWGPPADAPRGGRHR